MAIIDELKKLKLKVFNHKYETLRSFGEANNMFYTFDETDLWDELANVYYRGIPGDLIFRVHGSSDINDLVSKGVILASILENANIIHATTQLSRSLIGEERRILVESAGFIYDVATGEKIEGCLYNTMYCPKYDEIIPASLYMDSQIYRDITTSLDEIKGNSSRRADANVAIRAFRENVAATGNAELIDRFNKHLSNIGLEGEIVYSPKVYTKIKVKDD